MGKLIIFTGASGSGKTTLRNRLLETRDIKMAEKFSEREHRGEGDDIIHVDDINAARVDLIYELNGFKYGINLRKIAGELRDDENLGIVISDVRVVREIKRRLGKQAEAYYIAAPIDSEELLKIHTRRNIDLLDDMPPEEQEEITRLIASEKALGEPDAKRLRELMGDSTVLPEFKEREKNISRLYRDYVDNMDLFDNVILNYDSIGDMVEQARTLLGHNINRVQTKSPIIFMLMAAQGAGKGTLLETISEKRLPNVEVVEKAATRHGKPKDNIDRIIAVGPEGKIPYGYSWQWTFHNRGDNVGTKYGVSTNKMRQDMKEGKNLILVSNMRELDNAVSLFGINHVVPVYLFPALTKEERSLYKDSSARDLTGETLRVAETIDVFREFLSRRKVIRNVILNTTDSEDLFNQFKNIYERYTRTIDMDFNDGEPGGR